MMKRLVSFSLVLVLGTGVFSGCKISDDSAREVTYVQESEWYETSNYATEIYQGYNGAAWDFTGDPVLFATEDEIIIKERFDGAFVQDFKVCDYSLNDDGSTVLNGSIDLIDEGLSYRAPSGIGGCSIYAWIAAENNLYCICSETALDAEGNLLDEVFVQELNVRSSSVGERIQNSVVDALFSGSSYPLKCWASEDSIYVVYQVSDLDNNTILKLAITDLNFTSFEETTLEVYDVNSYIDGVYTLGDNKALVIIGSYVNQENEAFLIDGSAFDMRPVESLPSEVLENKCSNVNDRILFTDITGIYHYDFADNAIVKIFDYNNCNINRAVVGDFIIAYATPDVIITYYMDNSTGEQGGMFYNVWKFKKADSNPNVGEVIIRVADFDGAIDRKTADAIYRFNEESDSVYLIFDDRYFLEDFLNVDASVMNSVSTSDITQYNLALLGAQTELMNQLRMDIIAGDGPDILLDSFNYGEINNDYCLMPLNDLLLDEVNEEDYLPAIFGYSDVLFQLPLSVRPVCVLWKREFVDVERNGGGITYEEYLSLVDSCANGSDPITSQKSQIDYFIELFDYSYSDFVVDGRVSIDNDEFRMMAQFVNTRLNPSSISSECFFDEEECFFFDGVNNFPIIREYQNSVVTALPSLSGDGGVKYYCSSSVALAATCPMVDELVPFLVAVLEEYGDEICVARVNAIAEQYVAYFNEAVANDVNVPYWQKDDYLFNGDEDDLYVETLTASSEIITSNSDVNLIFYEEMQAYFAGDKTLDEVIPIIADRVQTVLDEMS